MPPRLPGQPPLAIDVARCEWERASHSSHEHGRPVMDLGGAQVVQRIDVDVANAERDGNRRPDP